MKGRKTSSTSMSAPYAISYTITDDINEKPFFIDFSFHLLFKN